MFFGRRTHPVQSMHTKVGTAQNPQLPYQINYLLEVTFRACG